MMNHNKSFNNQIKLIFFKLSKLSLVLSLSLLMILQTGCATKDEEAPVITNVKVEGNVVTIEASDNVAISAYLIYQVPYGRQPMLTNESWQITNVQTITEDGVYYIWVKDSSDNLGQYSEPVSISFNLAQRFDHLNWLTPAEGTKVVDGVTYDLAALKAEYGDLYRLVEPLSREEIEYRFEYLAKLGKLRWTSIKECLATKPEHLCGFYSTVIGTTSNNEASSDLSDIHQSSFKYIYTIDDERINHFKKYVIYVESANYYASFSGVQEYSYDGEEWVLDTIMINNVPFEQKEYYVREFLFRYDAHVSTYSKLGLEFKWFFEDIEGSRID